MTLVKFSNGNRTSSLNPWIGDVFENLFDDSFISDRLTTKVPAVNIAETVEQYHIELAAPGLNKKDFKINLEKNVLSISAEHKEEQKQEDKNYSRREYSYNSFVRSFNLPDTVDQSNIEAEYENGILKINVAKREEAKYQSRQIAVK
ncbi:MAG: Hsp20/alpha crystallin family protein [Sphingobacteriaceae bacterium]